VSEAARNSACSGTNTRTTEAAYAHLRTAAAAAAEGMQLDGGRVTRKHSRVGDNVSL